MVNCCLTWCSPRMTATTTCAVCTTWCWALRGNHIHLHPVPSTTGLRFARSHRPWGQLSAAAAVALQRQTCYATMAWPQNSSDQPTSTEWNAAADNVTAVRWFDKCDAFAMSTIHENDMISIQWCLLCVCVCVYILWHLCHLSGWNTVEPLPLPVLCALLSHRVYGHVPWNPQYTATNVNLVICSFDYVIPTRSSAIEWPRDVSCQ